MCRYTPRRPPANGPVDPLNVRLLSSLENTTVLDAVIRAVEPVAGRLVSREPVRRILHGDSTGVPLHLIVRDLPYGAWFMAQFLDLFSDPGSTRAARRLVGLGVVTAVPTAITGWAEWALADSNIRRVGIVHAAVQGGAVLIFLGSWAARVHDRHALGVHLARLGGIGLAVGGFLGGHMARGRRVGTTAPTRSIDPRWSGGPVMRTTIDARTKGFARLASGHRVHRGLWPGQVCAPHRRWPTRPPSNADRSSRPAPRFDTI